MIHEKRGQLTVFIILGIVILLAVALIIYLQTRAVQQISEIAILEAVPTVEEAIPVQEFITSCVSDSLRLALKETGHYGGYSEETSLEFNLNIAEPTEGESIQFLEGSSIRIPYWHYMSSDNLCSNCVFSSKMPNLHKNEGSPSIEEELEKTMPKYFDNCILEFEELSDFEVTAEVPKFKITIRQ